MIVFSKDGKRFVNTDNISCFSVKTMILDEAIETAYSITADNAWLGNFSTEEEALKVLNEIFGLAISGANSYQIE